MQWNRILWQAESSNSDLHLAIHSNAAPANAAGRYTGADIYYYPTSTQGKRFAQILQNNYKTLYPDPNNVEILPTTSLAEVRRTKAPSALIEVAYHDNPEDAQWIRDNINNIARNLSKSVAEYFNVPFVEP